jgi:hypothetical protein
MSVLKLTLISDPSKFRAGLSAASKDLKKFQYTANSVSRGLNKVLGAAGLGIGVAKLSGFLKESAKAAVEDTKSKNLLALALKNTLGATTETIAGNEKWIASVSLATAQFDDKLRPALAQTVRATGDLSKGQSLLRLALDVSAGTGKDLTAVTGALSKAYNGNQTALKKLVPGLKVGADWVSQLEMSFKGAAETAANSDPYQKFAVLMDQLKETIGMELLPALEQFSKYLSSPEGQQNLKQIVDIFVLIAQTIGNVIKLIVENIVVVKALVAAVLFAKTAWAAVTFAVKVYDIAVKIAAISTKALKAALVSTGIGAIAVAVGVLAENWFSAADAKNQYLNVPDPNDYTDPETLWWLDPKNVATKVKDLIPEYSDAWRALGYATYGEYLLGLKEIYDQSQTKSQKLKDLISTQTQQIKNVAVKFRDAVGLAFGTFGKDENSVFNVDMVIEKLKRMVDAARGFAGNIEKLKKAGAGQDVINEIVGMGAAQGNIVAKGLLSSGRLSEYLGLRGSLYATGTAVGTAAVGAVDKTYKIEVTERNMTAQAIIDAIKQYEKKTGRKYFVN